MTFAFHPEAEKEFLQRQTMQPDAGISWPVAYVDLEDSRSFMLIEEHEWTNDVDAKHAIGPAGSAAQFFIDAEGEVFAVTCTGLGAGNVPNFSITRATRKIAFENFREHVVAWLRDEGIDAAVPEKLPLQDLVRFICSKRDAGK